MASFPEPNPRTASISKDHGSRCGTHSSSLARHGGILLNATVTIPLCALLPFLLACGNGGDSNDAPSGPRTTYLGAFASGTRSGTLAVAMSAGSTSGASGLPAGPNAPVVGASSAATGTLVFIDGSSLLLSGSFSPSTGVLALHGNGGSFLDGMLSGGALSGTAASSGSSGIFVSFPPAASGEVSRVLCGTFSGSDVGFWNLVIAPTGAVRGVAASIRSATNTMLSGTLSGSALSLTSSQPGSAEGALSADGTSVSGTWLAQGSGTFQGGTVSCGTTTPGTAPPTAPPPNVSGSWVTASSADPRAWTALLQAGSAVTGSGVLTTSPIVPISGPSAPAWTGDAYTITSGSFDGSTMTFSASLGSNPVGGTFVHGTLSFTGTLTGASTLTGTMNFTPPRTATQVFAARTLTGFVFLRR